MSKLTKEATQVAAAYPAAVSLGKLPQGTTIQNVATALGVPFDVAQGALRDLAIR